VYDDRDLDLSNRIARGYNNYPKPTQPVILKKDRPVVPSKIKQNIDTPLSRGQVQPSGNFADMSPKPTKYSMTYPDGGYNQKSIYFDTKEQWDAARSTYANELQGTEERDGRFMGTLARKPTFATGGSLGGIPMKAVGGSLKRLSAANLEVKGPDHNAGGVKLPSLNAEVEGGETIHNGYVISDDLGFAKLHRPIAKAIGLIESKPKSAARELSLKKMREREEQLIQAQVDYKLSNNIK
jgi:hypothetical protein